MSFIILICICILNLIIICFNNHILNYKLLYYNFNYQIQKATHNFKYLILSFALNFNYSKIKNFILSLNRTNYKGNLIIFAHSTLYPFKKMILSFKINVIALNNQYPYYPSNHTLFPISIINIKKNLFYYTQRSFVTYRYFIINLFIKYYGYKYKFILITDIMDVLFQLNPFEWNIQTGVYLVEEHPYRVIRGDKSNANYVRIYQPTRKLYNSKVLNGGVMYGTYPEIHFFLKDFLEYLCLFDCNGNDQGGLNSFARSYKYFSYPLFILNSSHTPVKTLALWLFDSKKCCLPKNNKILNRDKSIPHIIHQYDRAIKQFLTNSKYLNLYKNYLFFSTH